MKKRLGPKRTRPNSEDHESNDTREPLNKKQRLALETRDNELLKTQHLQQGNHTREQVPNLKGLAAVHDCLVCILSFMTVKQAKGFMTASRQTYNAWKQSMRLYWYSFSLFESAFTHRATCVIKDMLEAPCESLDSIAKRISSRFACFDDLLSFVGKDYDGFFAFHTTDTAKMPSFFVPQDGNDSRFQLWQIRSYYRTVRDCSNEEDEAIRKGCFFRKYPYWIDTYATRMMCHPKAHLHPAAFIIGRQYVDFDGIPQDPEPIRHYSLGFFVNRHYFLQSVLYECYFDKEPNAMQPFIFQAIDRFGPIECYSFLDQETFENLAGRLEWRTLEHIKMIVALLSKVVKDLKTHAKHALIDEEHFKQNFGRLPHFPVMSKTLISAYQEEQWWECPVRFEAWPNSIQACLDNWEFVETLKGIVQKELELWESGYFGNNKSVGCFLQACKCVVEKHRYNMRLIFSPTILPFSAWFYENIMIKLIIPAETDKMGTSTGAPKNLSFFVPSNDPSSSLASKPNKKSIEYAKWLNIWSSTHSPWSRNCLCFTNRMAKNEAITEDYEHGKDQLFFMTNYVAQMKQMHNKHELLDALLEHQTIAHSYADHSECCLKESFMYGTGHERFFIPNYDCKTEDCIKPEFIRALAQEAIASIDHFRKLVVFVLENETCACESLLALFVRDDAPFVDTVSAEQMVDCCIQVLQEAIKTCHGGILVKFVWLLSKITSRGSQRRGWIFSFKGKEERIEYGRDKHYFNLTRARALLGLIASMQGSTKSQKKTINKLQKVLEHDFVESSDVMSEQRRANCRKEIICALTCNESSSPEDAYRYLMDHIAVAINGTAVTRRSQSDYYKTTNMLTEEVISCMTKEHARVVEFAQKNNTVPQVLYSVFFNSICE